MKKRTLYPQEDPPNGGPLGRILSTVITVAAGVFLAFGVNYITQHDSQALTRTGWIFVAIGFLLGVLVAVMPEIQEHERNRRKAEELRLRKHVLKVVRKWIQDELGKAKQKPIDLDFKIVDSAVTGPRNQISLGDIRRVFAKFEDELLILGVAGAGKTIALLTLTQHLLRRVERDPTSPIPIILNLSSWKRQWTSFEEWLLSELKFQYDIPRVHGVSWIRTRKIALMLDSLDDVPKRDMVSCIKAINILLAAGDLPVAVCCRTEIYENLEQHLRLRGAIVINPLRKEQIDQYIQTHTESHRGVGAILADDPTLYELLNTPLMLTIASQTFANTDNLHILEGKDIAERRHHLLDVYEQTMFARSKIDVHRRETLIRQLSWLAQNLSNHGRTDFFIELVQPDWLPSRNLIIQYWFLDRLGTAMVAGLTLGGLFAISILLYYSFVTPTGSDAEKFLKDFLTIMMLGFLVGGMFGGITQKPKNLSQQLLGTLNSMLLGVGLLGFSGFLIAGSGVGLYFAFLGALAGALAPTNGFGPRHISIADRFSWSGLRAIHLLPVALIIGTIAGLLGVLVGQFAGLASRFSGPLGGAIAGILVGLTLSFLFGISFSTGKGTTGGIRQSIRNSIYGSAIGGVVFGIGSQIISGGPVTWLVSGFMGAVIGGLSFGGFACFSHFALRIILWRANLIPINQVEWLEECIKLSFLRKTGESYSFLHGLLLEYFYQSRHSGEKVKETRSSPLKLLPWESPEATLALTGLLVVAVFSSGLGSWFPKIDPNRKCVNIEKNSRPTHSMIRVCSSRPQQWGRVEAGEAVQIVANGSLSLGSWLGKAGPEGTERGFLGIPAGNGYDIEPEYPQGALMYRITGEHGMPDWRVYKGSETLSIDKGGVLEFAINDREDENNLDYIEVEVKQIR